MGQLQVSVTVLGEKKEKEECFKLKERHRTDVIFEL